MKTDSTYRSHAGLVTCVCMLTAAVICGISLVQGQDIPDTPARSFPPLDAPAEKDKNDVPSGFPARKSLTKTQSNTGRVENDFAPDTNPETEPETRANPTPGPRPSTPIGLPGAPVTSPGVYASPEYTTIWRRTAPDAAAREQGKKYQELDKRIADLVKKHRETKDKKKQNEVREQIQDLTDEQFDLRQKGREAEVARLKKRLTEVEASVKKRKSLKAKIVERRVDDILAGPNVLEWDENAAFLSSYFPSGATGAVPRYGYPAKANPGAEARAVPVREPVVLPQTAPTLGRANVTETRTEVKTVKRGVPKQVSEVVIGPDGKPKTVTRTMLEVETVQVPVTTTQQVPATSFARSGAPSAYAGTVPMNLASGATVAEAETRVRIVERNLETCRNLEVHAALDRNDQKVKEAALEGELELAKLQLAQAKRAYEASQRLIDLEVRRSMVALEVAKADLDQANAISERVPGSISKSSMRQKEASVRQAQLAVERAKTWAELHQRSSSQVDSDPSQEEPPIEGDVLQPTGPNPTRRNRATTR